jgi:hypothetical protein
MATALPRTALAQRFLKESREIPLLPRVGSRTGAVFRRSGLACLLPLFLLGVPAQDRSLSRPTRRLA